MNIIEYKGRKYRVPSYEDVEPSIGLLSSIIDNIVCEEGIDEIKDYEDIYEQFEQRALIELSRQKGWNIAPIIESDVWHIVAPYLLCISAGSMDIHEKRLLS